MKAPPAKQAKAGAGRGTSSFHRILCPTDFSRAARASFLKAVALAAQANTTLTLLHVLPPPISRTDLCGISEGMYRALRETEARVCRRRMDQLLAAARTRGIRAAAELAVGFPDREILHCAKLRRSGLIVIGAHGVADRKAMGSVAERVMRFATVPVLVVRDVKPVTSRARSQRPDRGRTI